MIAWFPGLAMGCISFCFNVWQEMATDSFTNSSFTPRTCIQSGSKCIKVLLVTLFLFAFYALVGQNVGTWALAITGSCAGCRIPDCGSTVKTWALDQCVCVWLGSKTLKIGTTQTIDVHVKLQTSASWDSWDHHRVLMAHGFSMVLHFRILRNLPTASFQELRP